MLRFSHEILWLAKDRVLQPSMELADRSMRLSLSWVETCSSMLEYHQHP